MKIFSPLLLRSGFLLWLLTLTASGVNIGNFVWHDFDADGTQDAGEPGISGVTVQLWNSAKTSLLDSAVTNSTGNYTVTAAGAGNYRIRIVLPSLHQSFSPKNLAGGDDQKDSDINPSGADLGFTDVFTIAPNVISTTIHDAGLISELPIGHTIGNYVFRSSADGTQPGSGFNGVTVQLLNSAGGVLQTTVSAAMGPLNGRYSFDAPPGTYRLKFLSPGGYVPSPDQNNGGDDTLDSDINANGETALFSLAAGQVRTDLDAAFVNLVNIGNFVWHDFDSDGAQDAGEPGIGGVTVQLWNSGKTSLLDSAVTSTSGTYSITAPGPGSYRVRVVLPSLNQSFSPKNLAGGDDQKDSDINPSGADLGFTDSFTIAPNVISTTIFDAGLISELPIGHTIGNYVFRNSADGTQPGFGFNGVTVQLLNVAGDVLQTTVSAALGSQNGRYSFDAPPGTYRLRFLSPAGYVPSPDRNNGGDDTLDSDINANGETALFILAAGQVRTDLDAAFVNLVNIGNLVWNDADEDGLKDAAEPGIPDVVVELWNSAKTQRLDSAVTNASGFYALTAPGPGDYRIWVLRPLATDLFSPANAGADDLADSDILSTPADFGFSATFTIAPNVISTTIHDAGLIFLPGPRTIPDLAILTLDASAPSLSFTGPVGGTYLIERSTNLGSWATTVSSFTTSGSKNLINLPALPPATLQAFWRVHRTR
ncbi:MAG: SdrD B-like domain-containing protein [Verrucomicrobiota bacterium]